MSPKVAYILDSQYSLAVVVCVPFVVSDCGVPEARNTVEEG